MDVLTVLALILLTAAGIAGVSVGMRMQQKTEYEESGRVAEPVFSAESGFYEGPFELQITVPEGYSAYYTLDGSLPDREALLYREPIWVSPGTGRDSDVIQIQNMQTDWLGGEGETHAIGAAVIRAVAISDKDGTAGRVVTATYFTEPTGFEDCTVVSLVADPDDLFGENGIYVTGKAYDDWYFGDRGRRCWRYLTGRKAICSSRLGSASRGRPPGMWQTSGFPSMPGRSTGEATGLIFRCLGKGAVIPLCCAPAL